MDSENLSSLIRLSVSDGQKTDSSSRISYRYIINFSYQMTLKHILHRVRNRKLLFLFLNQNICCG